MKPRRIGPRRMALVPVLFAVGLFVAPIASASSGPPFRVLSEYTSELTVTTSCASGHSLAAFGWKASSGRGIAGESVAATACPSKLPNGGVNSYSNWSGSWTVFVPVQLLPNASQDWVNASWSFAWSTNTSYNISKLCSGSMAANASYGWLSCGAAAVVEMQTWNFLYDGSTGYYYGPSNVVTPSLYNYSAVHRDIFCHPKCSRTHSATGSGGPRQGSLNFTYTFQMVSPNPKHRWSLVILTEISVIASITTDSRNFGSVQGISGSAKASLDMFSGSRGAALTQLTVA
jgi:hypothetical protein